VPKRDTGIARDVVLCSLLRIALATGSNTTQFAAQATRCAIPRAWIRLLQKFETGVANKNSIPFLYARLLVHFP